MSFYTEVGHPDQLSQSSHTVAELLEFLLATQQIENDFFPKSKICPFSFLAFSAADASLSLPRVSLFFFFPLPIWESY